VPFICLRKQASWPGQNLTDRISAHLLFRETPGDPFRNWRQAVRLLFALCLQRSLAQTARHAGSKNRRSSCAVDVVCCKIFCCKIFAPCVGPRADRCQTPCQRGNSPNTYLSPDGQHPAGPSFCCCCLPPARVHSLSITALIRTSVSLLVAPSPARRLRAGTPSGGKALVEVRSCRKVLRSPWVCRKPAAYSPRHHDENRNCHKSGVA